MDGFYLQILAGLSSGGIYACLAVALVMIYRATTHVNFAQGEMAMLSAYFCWLCLDLGLGYVAAAVLTLIVSFVFGFAVQIGLMSRLGRASNLIIVTGYLALFMIFNSIAGAGFGYVVKQFPSPFGMLEMPGLGVSGHIVGTLLTTASLMLVVYTFFRFTKLGLAMRAAAVAPTASRLAGINVGMMLALGWGFAAAIGSISAMLAAPIFYLEPHMMLGVLLYAFAGALLGGISNPWGAAVGALLVGVLENLMGAYVVGTDIKMTIALMLIVLVLVLKPEGLFGQPLVARA
jgi:branched-chain amino acid transport system permease protein